MTAPPEVRLERLEKQLDELSSLNLSVPVLVEGSRDRNALLEIGLTGEVLLVNTGRPLIDRISTIASEHGELVILTDWDRKGTELFERLAKLAASEGMKVHEEPWRRLKPLVQKDIQAVEDLPPLLRHLREKCVKG